MAFVVVVDPEPAAAADADVVVAADGFAGPPAARDDIRSQGFLGGTDGHVAHQPAVGFMRSLKRTIGVGLSGEGTRSAMLSAIATDGLVLRLRLALRSVTFRSSPFAGL